MPKIWIDVETKKMLELVIKEHNGIYDYNDAILYLLTLDGKYTDRSYYLPVASKVYLPAEKRWIFSRRVRKDG